MTVVPSLSPEPVLDPVLARDGWLPGLTSVTRLVGSPPTPEPPLARNLELAPTEPVLALVPEPVSRSVSARACAGRPPRGGDLRLVDGGEEPVATWAKLFCQTVIEVIAGDRSPQQLLRRLDVEVYQSLLERRQELQRVGGGQRRHPVRAQVRSVRVCQPAPLVAEVSARVEHGQRSRAMAVRLELVEGRWVCTALELG